MRWAAGPCEWGNTGCGTIRPCFLRSTQIFLGKPKWAARSPCRSTDLPTADLKDSSPRSPGAAWTPGQDVTSATIRSLTDRVVVMNVLLSGPLDGLAQSTSSSELEVKLRR